MEFFRKSAEQNHAEVQLHLGHLYALNKDFKQAKEWYGKACDNGLQKGCDAYKELNMNGY